MCIHAISLVSTTSGRALTCTSDCSGDLQEGSAAEFERAEEELSALDTELQGLRQNVSTKLCCNSYGRHARNASDDFSQAQVSGRGLPGTAHLHDS